MDYNPRLKAQRVPMPLGLSELLPVAMVIPFATMDAPHWLPAFLQICIKFETPSTLIACLRSRAILKYRISECQLLLLGGNHFGKEQFWYLFFLYCSCCCWVAILRVLRHHLHSVLLCFGWTHITGECIIKEGDYTESTSIVSPFSVTNRSMDSLQWCQTTTVLCSWVK